MLLRLHPCLKVPVNERRSALLDGQLPQQVSTVIQSNKLFYIPRVMT